MRRDGKLVVLETVSDGVAAAQAGQYGNQDNLLEPYRNLHPGQYPITLGTLASKDMVAGLKCVAHTEITGTGSLTRDIASGYLVELGVEVCPVN